MKKTIIYSMILTIAIKCMGFVRNMVLSYNYGASATSDAYVISMSVISLAGLVGSGIFTTFIPMYTKIEEESGVKANMFASRLWVILMILGIILITIGSVFARPLTQFFASGFSGDTLDLATRFTRVSLLTILLNFTYILAQNYLHIKGRFIIPLVSGIPFNFIMIGGIILSASLKQPMIMIWCALTAAFSQVLIIVYYLFKSGFRFNILCTLRDANLKTIFILAIPTIIGGSLGNINAIVDKTLASQVGEGAISSLSYASTLTGFINGVFVSIILNMLYPLISKMVAGNDKNGIIVSIRKAIVSVSIITIPICLGAIILAEPIVKLVFERGSFGTEAVKMTTIALTFYSPTIITGAIGDALTRYFYAYKDTKTPLKMGIVGVSINVSLNLLLYKPFGIMGLALATSITTVITLALNFILLRKKVGAFGMLGITNTFGKMSLAAIIMGIFVHLSYKTLFIFSPNFTLIVTIILGAIVYFALLYFAKIKEVDEFKIEIKTKLNKYKLRG